VQRVRRSAGSHARCRVLFHLLARRPGDPSTVSAVRIEPGLLTPAALCAGCYTQAIPPVGSCLDCYAWGANPQHPLAVPRMPGLAPAVPAAGTVWDCRPDRVPGPHGFVPAVPQTSWAAADDHRSVRPGGRQPARTSSCSSPTCSNENGARHGAKTQPPPSPAGPSSRALHQAVPATETDVFGEQLRLFTIRHDLAAAGRTGLHFARRPAQAAGAGVPGPRPGRRRSWRRRTVAGQHHGIRIVLGLQPGGRPQCAPAKVDCLKGHRPARPDRLQVLDAASVLIEDRTPAIDAWIQPADHGPSRTPWSPSSRPGSR